MSKFNVILFGIFDDQQKTKIDASKEELIANTVNLDIFARTLFLRNFAYAKFRENKTLA